MNLLLVRCQDSGLWLPVISAQARIQWIYLDAGLCGNDEVTKPDVGSALVRSLL